MERDSTRLSILVATMTGVAEMLAEDLQAEFGEGRAVDLRLLENLGSTDLEPISLALVISSTYGTGDVPETAEDALNALRSDRPDLSSLTYGVISLGDSSYVDTFAKGGEHWDEALAACGARRVGEILKIDCQTAENPLDVARDWMAGWLKAVEAA